MPKYVSHMLRGEKILVRRTQHWNLRGLGIVNVDYTQMELMPKSPIGWPTICFLKKLSAKLYMSTLGVEGKEKGCSGRKLPAEMGLSKCFCPLALLCPLHSLPSLT